MEAIREAVAKTGAGAGARVLCTRTGRRREGVVNLAKRLARVTLTNRLSDFGEDAEEKMRTPIDDPRLEQLRRGIQSFMGFSRSMELDELYDGSATYVAVAGRGWMRREDSGGPLAVDHPLWLLDALLGARDDAEEVGQEEVRGAATTRYRLTLDLAAADEQLPAGITVPGPSSFRSLRARPAEVWIDHDGWIRRMTYDAGATDAETIELWDFGIDVGLT
jgi:hypothetical protein